MSLESREGTRMTMSHVREMKTISLPIESHRRCCCSAQAADSPAPVGPPSRSSVRRGLELAGWLIPGTLLAFFPKCPLCVAGYVALATGLGLSLTLATYLRWGLLFLCLASLLYMAQRSIVRAFRRKKNSPEQACSGLIV